MYVLKTSSEREKQMREQLDKTIPILDKLVKDMETIKSIFDNGVTLWHHANTMYNYDADNSI